MVYKAAVIASQQRHFSTRIGSLSLIPCNTLVEDTYRDSRFSF